MNDESRPKAALAKSPAKATTRSVRESLAEIEMRLHVEIAALRAERLAHDAEQSAELTAYVKSIATRPTYAEIATRRGEHGRANRAQAFADASRDGWNK